jgi:hypothetical protein
MIYFIAEKCVEERFARRFRLPPRGSTVTNTRSISASCLGSSIRITHRRLVSLSIYSLSKFSGSACFPCAVSFWPQDLERVGIHNGSLVIEIERVEDERFSLRVKDPAEGFLGAAAAINIENIRTMTCRKTERGAAIRPLPFRSRTCRWCVRTRASNFFRVASSSELPRLSRSA